MHLGRHRHRAQQVTGEGRQIGNRGRRAVTGSLRAAVQAGGGHTQRFQHRLAEVTAEFDAGRLLHGLGQHREAVIGIHPAGAGSGQGLPGEHRQPRSMGQQMPDGGSGRSGRGIQIHRAFFDRDLHRTCHQRLGHRRQRELPFGVAVAGQHSGRSDHRGGHSRHRPIVECSEYWECGHRAAAYRPSARLKPMSQTVRGVISRTKGEPVELVDIVIPDPGPGEVVVDITACGVCHTDLTYREGGINDEYPFLLGHEAAGTVESVGAGVTAVAPGDFVILNWRAVCGQCRACKRGRPQLCFDTFNAEQKMTLTDGTELTPALGIGAFADKTLVAAGQATLVNPAADPAVAGLLGCGVMAGIGAAINTGAITRDDTVAVIGCGGVGDAAIAGAALVGAKRIIAIDTDNTKLDWARKFGATHTINARDLDVVKTVQDLTDGFGANVVIDAVGRPETWKQAFYARDLAGTVVLVGVPTPDMRLDMPLVDFFSHGGALKSSWYGDCLPERDFPTLIDLYLQGRLPLEKFVSERIGLDDIEEAFHKMHDGKVLRSVVLL